MNERAPAVGLIGTPTKRAQLLALAAEADRKGLEGIAVFGVGGGLATCGSIAHVTTRIPFWTSIQPIYLSHPNEVAVTAGHLHEISGGRFRLGLGVSHAPAMDGLGLSTGKPLSDMRSYVDRLRGAERSAGQLPPIWLAALRDKMLALSAEIADGAIWANPAFTHMATQLATLPDERRAALAMSVMLPTVIDADRDAARAVLRKGLTGYLFLPNYRNYWKAAGYVDEMQAVEGALAAGQRDRLTELMTDDWLDDCTISGSEGAVRERIAQWYELGVTPIAVMSSTSGGQAHAIGQLLALY